MQESRTHEHASLSVTHKSEAEMKLRRQLASYANLEDNWDGVGAKSPPQSAVNDVLKFLDSRPEDIPLPYPEAGTEGDLGIYWDYSDIGIFAEVTFEGDGRFAYFAVHGTPNNVSEKCGADGLNVSDTWPADMLRLLRGREST